ncbi:MAG: hypothetical protein H6744_11695 [Deltaproteobacteria bacterium]|nr:hypothetical protein [Deltaproteobacteria bacterium]
MRYDGLAVRLLLMIGCACVAACASNPTPHPSTGPESPDAFTGGASGDASDRSDAGGAVQGADAVGPDAQGPAIDDATAPDSVGAQDAAVTDQGEDAGTDPGESGAEDVGPSDASSEPSPEVVQPADAVAPDAAASAGRGRGMASPRLHTIPGRSG